MSSGSPAFATTSDEVRSLRQLGLNWTEVSQRLLTTTKTLLKWRKLNNFEVTSHSFTVKSSICVPSIAAGAKLSICDELTWQILAPGEFFFLSVD